MRDGLVSTVGDMDPGSPGPATAMDMVDEATDRVLSDLRILSDADLRASSRLPDWTRGHVLSHLARNADALGNLLESARTGEQIYAYQSREQRAADIAAGADRALDVQAADIVAAHEAFRDRASRVTDWDATVTRMAGDPGIPAWWVPLLRLGEVEIHHLDLDTGYDIAQWPPEWVRAFLPYAALDLADRAAVPIRLQPDDSDAPIGAEDTDALVVAGPASSVLAWMIGRDEGSDLRTTPDGPLPDLGTWR